LKQSNSGRRTFFGAFKSAFGKILNIFRRKAELFKSLRVEDFPDSMKRFTIYLASGGENIRAAGLVCPCGCGEVIELNLLASVRPCWQVIEHPKGLVSLSPSVRRMNGCRSHFWIRNGQINWC
jgi:hypothetical protein